MQAYETGLKAGDSRIVLSPKSDFFRYFGTPTPPPEPSPTPAAPASQ
jgi:membrane protease subunit HflC